LQIDFYLVSAFWIAMLQSCKIAYFKILAKTQRRWCLVRTEMKTIISQESFSIKFSGIKNNTERRTPNTD